MAITYSVQFVNDESTRQPWTMAIYQTIPDMGLFDNVSWKQASAPQGSTKSVSWELRYNVVLAEFFSAGNIGVYESSQILYADLDTRNERVQKFRLREEGVPPGVWERKARRKGRGDH